MPSGGTMATGNKWTDPREGLEDAMGNKIPETVEGLLAQLLQSAGFNFQPAVKLRDALLHKFQKKINLKPQVEGCPYRNCFCKPQELTDEIRWVELQLSTSVDHQGKEQPYDVSLTATVSVSAGKAKGQCTDRFEASVITNPF